MGETGEGTPRPVVHRPTKLHVDRGTGEFYVNADGQRAKIADVPNDVSAKDHLEDLQSKGLKGRLMRVSGLDKIFHPEPPKISVDRSKVQQNKPDAA